MLSAQWVSSLADARLEDTREFWLTQRQSTTKLIASLYPAADINLKVCRATWLQPQAEECAYLGIANEQCWVREVLLSIKNIPWMWARSIFPANTLQASQIDLQHLDTTPLGSVIFANPTLQRSAFDFKHLTSADWLLQAAAQQSVLSSPDLWARRSIFTLHDTAKFALYEVLLETLPRMP